MAIVLHSGDTQQVSSASSFEVLVGEPSRQLLVMSGIAIPAFWTNHDEEVNRTEIVVHLGVFVARLEHATAHVGLASIANDETNFLFALDNARVELDPRSGELLLKVDAALLGEETWLHRFGYQIVAHVHRVAARISGTIRLPRDILDIEGWSTPDVASLFVISANRIEQLPPSGSGMQFVTEKLIPVAHGHIERVRTDDGDAYVDYAIDSCPFNVPLRVEVELVGRLDLPSVGVGQTAGPRPVVLSASQPSATGVDFGVGRFRGPN